MLSLRYGPVLTSVGFPCGSAGKESACNVGDLGSLPGLGRFPEKGKDYSLQYSWASPVAQLVKNPPAMWETWVRSLGQEDPWSRKWKSTPVFLPGKFHEQRSLEGYSPWHRQELVTAEHTCMHRNIKDVMEN